LYRAGPESKGKYRTGICGCLFFLVRPAGRTYFAVMESHYFVALYSRNNLLLLRISPPFGSLALSAP
jgi:hypothetical protein